MFRRRVLLLTVLGLLLGVSMHGAGVGNPRLASAAPPDRPGQGVQQQEEHHDASPPLGDIPPAPHSATLHVIPNRPLPRTAGPSSEADTARQPSTASPSVVRSSPILDFAGVGNGFSGPAGPFSVASAPPDTNGAAGPNHYVQIVNTDFAIFNKSGTAIFGPVAINTLWSGFGGGCQTNNDGDPSVLYDKIADRWMITQFSVSTTPYLQCVAVSQTGDPTGAYFRYSFSFGTTDFPDYPKLGIWPDAYYATFNIFAGGSTFSGARVCAFNRSAMLTGAAATQQCFNTSSSFGGILPSDLDGATLPPAGSPNFIVGLGASANQLALWKFHVDWTTPANSTFTGPTVLATAAYSEACSGGTCIPQLGTTQQLDSLADRMMYRLAYRNFGDHESLVVNHSVTAGSSTGVRWYELRSPNGTPVIYQQGTYAPDANYRWMGSIAMDQAGDIALGYSVSGSSLHPSIRYTGRLAGDALGQMTMGESVIFNGAGSQTGQSLSRWGDYSSMSVDPADDCTFWYTNEYIPRNGAFNWSTRIASFKFPGCGSTTGNDFSISASPSSLTIAQGASGTSTISTATTSGATQTVSLSASGLPSGASASFSPASVTSGGSSTLTVNTGTAAPGTYSITITGTGTSATHTTTVTLTIPVPPPPNDFSISASPSSLTIAQGAAGTSTISTAVTSGSAQTVSLSASGVPAGAAASFSPTSVTAGGSSTLTINVGASTPATSYTITVTGTGASATHSTTVSLTVTGSGGGGITNGGFETGSFTGWTTTGASETIVNSGCHGGTYCAMAGSTSPTNGDSNIAQTFTAPAGATGISLWYKETCPDTITYDWAVATLKDNTAGTTATLLPKVCATTSWTNVVGSVTAGHSYTLTLTSHDDNYPGDATYTLFDDVTLTSAAPPPAGITNGGFESGSTGWTTSGTTSIVTAGCHGGTHCAQAGSTSPTNGDSSFAQTFTAPSGTTTLSLWYKVVCPDTLTYDWATATLKDNTAGTTATVLAKTCTNNGAWAHVTAAVTAGHSYTLTLTSHDDNYAGDPTYTLFDDVTLQ